MIKPIWDQILFQSRVRPGALAVFGPAGPIAYEGLVHDVDALATELLERGLTRQDMVGVEMGFSYLHLLLILALDRLSIPSMSFAAPSAVPSSPDGLAAFGVTAIVSGEAAPAMPFCRWITLLDRHRPTFGKPDLARLARIDSPPDGLVRLVWSSGTTGGAKGSLLTRTVQLRRVVNLRQVHGIGPHTRYFAGMPLSSITGYVRAVAVLAAGAAVILPCPPTDFVSLANTVGVTMTTGTPALLSELLGKSAGTVRRLETMACFELLGEHLPARLAQEARLFLTPHLWIVYGSTEADRVAMADAALCIADSSAAGFVTPWIEAQIVDHADRPLPNGQEGRVRVRGASVITGYYNNPDATRRNFRDGWFHAGDLGIITAQGLLRVTGRIEELITRDGVSISALPLEEMIRGVPGVRDVAVFALAGADGTQEFCAALVLDANVEAGKIGGAIRARMGDQAPSRVFALDALPRSANGKVLRRDLADMARRAGKV
jgi:acyl-CoA synthetase (AMP-forming)/AMP-acid ligase II